MGWSATGWPPHQHSDSSPVVWTSSTIIYAWPYLARPQRCVNKARCRGRVTYQPNPSPCPDTWVSVLWELRRRDVLLMNGQKADWRFDAWFSLRGRDGRKGLCLWIQERAPWLSLPNKPLGRLIPSQFATPQQPSSWSLRPLPPPAAHPGCRPAALREALHATLLCCSASCWWTVAWRCRDASPWHTHPGTTAGLMPSVHDSAL